MPLDLRTRKLAKQTIKYSLNIQPNEKVIISGSIESIDFMKELYKEIVLAKGIPLIKFNLPDIDDFYYKYATKEQIERFPKEFDALVKGAQHYISIDSTLNTKSLANGNVDKINAKAKIVWPISEYICNSRPKMKRITIAYPCYALAQDAEMSINEYENFVYLACLQDWEKLKKIFEKISKVFEKGKEVKLIGENVDLSFSIKGKNVISDNGEENMPGGEIFMTPVRESLNGWIKFEFPAIRNGKEVRDIKLVFQDGKVVESDASYNREFLEKCLKLDENASFVGEFGIGCNPKIKKFTKNLLFDEKINGTIHLALGNAYKENGGGNDSSIHWDIVKDMKKAKIILDGKVIQENGVWKIKSVDNKIFS
jgi:aminopeptidase